MGCYVEDGKYYKPDVVTPNFNEDGSVDVHLTEEEWDICDAQSSHRWANTKKGRYGKGLLNTKDDLYRTERTGLEGETSYAKIFNDKVDCVYRVGGDKYDFLLGNKLVDLKCAATCYNKGLIHHINERGRIIPLDKDIYIFSYLLSEDRDKKTSSVRLVGWCTREDIESKGAVKLGIARGSKHHNWEMSYKSLRPVVELYNMYK